MTSLKICAGEGITPKNFGVRVVRETRSLRPYTALTSGRVRPPFGGLGGNINSKFIEDNRPSLQGSREYLKFHFGGIKVDSVTWKKS